jgi:hypothetical protein
MSPNSSENLFGKINKATDNANDTKLNKIKLISSGNFNKQ